MNFFKKYYEEFKHYLEITLGSLIMALAMNMFFVPHNIAPGGVSGLAIVIHASFKFPVGVTMLVLNVPLFLIGIKRLGGRFGLRTLYGTLAFSVLVDLTSWIKIGTKDVLLATIFGGIVTGVGLGLIFRSSATTGGSDLAARIIREFFPHVSVGKIMFGVDFAIIIMAAIIFKSYELGLYAILSLYISTQVIDSIVEGSEISKGAYIISEKSEIIAENILTDLQRGVTALKGIGMYTRTDRDVLFVVVDRIEIARLKKIVYDVDHKAFVILSDIKEVLGEGFKKAE